MQMPANGLTIVYKTGSWMWQIRVSGRVIAESTTRLTTAKGCWKNLVMATDTLLAPDSTPLTIRANNYHFSTQLHEHSTRGTAWCLMRAQNVSIL